MKRFFTSRSTGAVFTSMRNRSVAALICGFPFKVSLVFELAARRIAATSRRSRAVQRAVTLRGHLTEAVVAGFDAVAAVCLLEPPHPAATRDSARNAHTATRPVIPSRVAFPACSRI
jgi:hypothetical protein